MFRFLAFFSLALVAIVCLLIPWLQGDMAYSSDEQALAEGERLFNTHCNSCHALEMEGIGPRLGGITFQLSEKDLHAFIRDPVGAIASGNPRAVALHERYGQTMPSYDWMDNRSIHQILSFLHDHSKKHKISADGLPDAVKLTEGLTGELAPPLRKSPLKIELEEVAHLPRLDYSTPELGIVTLRAHPSGDGTFWVSDQGGVLYEVRNGKTKVLLDMRDVIPSFSIGPGLATGLGSFDFHPDFMSNGLVYIAHAEKYNGQTADYSISDSVQAEVQWVIGEWKIASIDQPRFRDRPRELLRLHAPTFGHGAQELAFVPGLEKHHADYGMLYWGFGDGGSNNIGMPALGHNPGSFLGTILRIDPQGKNSRNGQYGIPDDNPFARHEDPQVLREIWAYGFRNPHRMAWDPLHNYRMMVTDVGEANLEEINIVEKGGDYGWPNREGTYGISTLKDLKRVFKLPESDKSLYKNPYVQYDHQQGYAISGGHVYQGNIQELKNKYIFGDIVNGRLFYVNIDKPLTDSIIYEIIVMNNGKTTSLSEITQTSRLHLRIGYDHHSKELYIITKSDGRIRKIASAWQ